jgi:hypothetical protein
MLPVTTQNDGIASHAPNFWDDNARWKAVRRRDGTQTAPSFIRCRRPVCIALLRGAASASRKRELPPKHAPTPSAPDFGHTNGVGRTIPRAPQKKGELVLTEQRPRMQSRAEVVPLVQGEGAIVPVHHRPVQGMRGIYQVNMRHAVSRLRSGSGHTLGIIFHDAK